MASEKKDKAGEKKNGKDDFVFAEQELVSPRFTHSPKKTSNSKINLISTSRGFRTRSLRW